MTKKKNTRKQTHSKKRKSTRKKQNPNLKIINILLAIVVILMSIITYLVLTNNIKEESPKKIEKPVEISKEIEKEINTISKELEIRKDKFEEYTKEFYKEYTEHTETKPVVKKEEKKPEIKKQTPIKKDEEKTIIKTKKPVFVFNKPKLVIIIDDVTTKSQLNKLNSLGYKVTPSILPPTPNHAESAKIVKGEEFYMIHFPLEAQNFNAAEKYTLRTTDSYEKIEKRVAQIRSWYPNALYTNNHTGSKFTSNEKSMNYLLKALKKHGFIFMDSRTTAKSVVKKLVPKYDMPYIGRNVFIDNEKDFNYIQNQLKKAVKIAKKNGTSIAIGHPYPVTIEVLEKSKSMFEGLDLIYLDELPYLN